MSLRSALAIIAVGAILTACQPAPNPDVSDVQLGSGEEGSQANQGDVQGLQTSPNYQLEGTMNEPAVKQLSDFAPIEASTVTLNTTKGAVVIELFRDKAPLTTINFLTLIEQGFYNGIVIHRVEPNFVVQFGDPLTKQAGTESRWGTGGPGYSIADEFHPELRHDGPGILSMANSGPNTGGSQVFITLDQTAWLDDKHAVFGRVTQGMDVVEALSVGDTIVSVDYQ